MSTAKYLITFINHGILFVVINKGLCMSVRIMLTLEDETHARLTELSVLQGIPVATLIRGLVEAQSPAVEAMIKALTRLNQGDDPVLIENEYLGQVTKAVLDEIRKG